MLMFMKHILVFVVSDMVAKELLEILLCRCDHLVDVASRENDGEDEDDQSWKFVILNHCCFCFYVMLCCLTYFFYSQSLLKTAECDCPQVLFSHKVTMFFWKFPFHFFIITGTYEYFMEYLEILLYLEYLSEITMVFGIHGFVFIWPFPAVRCSELDSDPKFSSLNCDYFWSIIEYSDFCFSFPNCFNIKHISFIINYFDLWHLQFGLLAIVNESNLKLDILWHDKIF